MSRQRRPRQKKKNLELLLALCLTLQGPLVRRLAPAEPVHGTPFHSWTCSCASVADVPVLMWALSLIPCGVPIWPLVLQWE